MASVGTGNRGNCRRRILEEIHGRRTTTRVEIAKALGISKPAVSDSVSELIRLGVVEEAGKVQSLRGGRRAEVLRFNENNRYIAVAYFNLLKPSFALTNLYGAQLASLAPTDAQMDGLTNYPDLYGCSVKALLAQAGLSSDQLAGFAIASPGAFDAHGRMIDRNPRYQGAPVADRPFLEGLRKTLGVPVYVLNDINAAALGEWSRGAGAGVRSMLYLSVGYGLGASFLQGGELYLGRDGAAGILYNYIDPEKERLGETLESAVCMNRLVSLANRDALPGNHMTFLDIVSKYRQGDAHVLSLIRGIAEDIGIVACNLANLLNVEKVVLGGEYTAFAKLLEEMIGDALRRRCPFPPSFSIGCLGVEAGFEGLSRWVQQKYFDQLCGEGANEFD